MDTQRQWGQPPGGMGPPGPGWRPPRRRLPAGAIAAGVVLLVVLLAVSSLGTLRWWPSFPNPFGAREVVVTDVEDRPGELGRLMRRVADAGVNVDLVYLATNTRLVVGAADLDAARSALGS